jgi:methylenetetrahydrofolate reductase (NADPH)
MPIFKADQIKAITAKSGCSIPAGLVVMMDKYQNDPEDMRKAGIEYASRQIRELIDAGVDGIHLYTMNRPKSTAEILNNIGDIS